MILLSVPVLTAYLAGIAAALLLAGIIAIVTGLHVVVTGRESWALIGSRRAGALLLTAGLVSLFLSYPNLPDLELSGPPAAPATPSAELQPSSVAPTREPSSVSRSATPDAAGPSRDPGGPDSSDAVDVLENLPVKGRAPRTGYDRVTQFGEAWLDTDHNGCDTRNDILQRDLTEVQRNGSCKVVAGLLHDPFTGVSIDFLAGPDTSFDVQVDHLVALSNAWQTGAQQLTLEQRVAFANDPLNLLAVDGQTNMQKGDGDAATWLPPNRAFRCDYVARLIGVKAAYGLWVTPAEREAMIRILSSCPDQPVHGSAPKRKVNQGAISDSASMAAPAPDYFANCSAARAAGDSPVRAGEAGYGAHLDRDGDGSGCEW